MSIFVCKTAAETVQADVVEARRSATVGNMSMTNALLQEWSGPYGGVPPWDRVQVSDFPEALGTALADKRAEVERIASNPEPPTFENTLVALERSGRVLERVLRLFNVMRLSMSTPSYRALDREWQPRLAAAADVLRFTPGLFERIEAVYASHLHRPLPLEDARLVELVRDEFIRSGSRLNASARAQLSAVNQELAGLYADGPSTVTEPEKSRDHTERMLSAMGAEVSESGSTTRIAPPSRLAPLSLRVPGDISSAAPWLVLVGDGPDATTLREFAAARSLCRVVFAGSRQPRDLPPIYAAADLFVLPSRHEPWGVVVNEAMAAGLPVVLTDRVGAAADLLVDGENGRLVPSGDSQASMRAPSAP